MASDLQRWVWKHDLGHSGHKISPDVQAEVYAWAQKHHVTDDFEILNHAIDLEVRRHPDSGGDFSVMDRISGALAPPGNVGYIKDAGGGGGAAAPAQAAQTPTTQATDPSKPSGGADVASKLSAFAQTDPGFGAFLQQNPDIARQITQGADAGTVSYWQDSGVDPNAKVLGTKAGTKAGMNTMDPMGLMHHGADVPTRVPVEQSADTWLKGLYAMTPAEVLDLQHRLWDQGWYSGSKITDFSQLSKGQPDAATLTAYVSALAETARYNYAGKRIGIDGVIGLGSPDAATAKAAQGQPFEKTNPADLRVALNAEAQQSLGRDATPQEVDAYAHKYLAEEEAARRELIAAGYANRTEGVTGPPSPSAGAAQFVDVNNLADKVAYGAAVKQQQFFAMLKSPV